MIFTDLVFVTSDNLENQCQEIHEFAKSIKFEKAWHMNSSGRVYYKCRLNYQRVALVRKGVYRISRKQMFAYLSKGKKPPIKYKVNYKEYYKNKFFQNLTKELMLYHKIDLPPKTVMHFKRHKIGIRSTTFYAENLKFIFEYSQKHPFGYCCIKEYSDPKNVQIQELSVPKYILTHLEYNTKLQIFNPK